MTSMTALSFGEGSNGISDCRRGGLSLDCLFNTISPFSDADPIMRGIRDGTMSWADAAELEEAEAAARMPVALFTAPATSAWAAAPTTPPRPRVTFACPQGAPLARPCPGAPARPTFKMLHSAAPSPLMAPSATSISQRTWTFLPHTLARLRASLSSSSPTSLRPKLP